MAIVKYPDKITQFLMDKKLLPPNTIKWIIVGSLDDIVKIYYETALDESLLDVILNGLQVANIERFKQIENETVSDKAFDKMHPWVQKELDKDKEK